MPRATVLELASRLLSFRPEAHVLVHADSRVHVEERDGTVWVTGGREPGPTSEINKATAAKIALAILLELSRLGEVDGSDTLWEVMESLENLANRPPETIHGEG
jgi:hypothetical protein